MSIEDQVSKENILFKIILVGPPAVGKTCILKQYTHNDFMVDYNVTIGVEFSSKVVRVNDNTVVKLQIWDTAGQESFRSIIKSFYRKAACVFLVYSVANRESFKQMDSWLKEAKENSAENSVFILVGNQCDRPSNEREVNHDEGVEFMKENGLALFFETSAKNGENIDNAFQEAAKIIFLKYINNELVKNLNKGGGGVPLANQGASKKKKCC